MVGRSLVKMSPVSGNCHSISGELSMIILVIVILLLIIIMMMSLRPESLNENYSTKSTLRTVRKKLWDGKRSTPATALTTSLIYPSQDIRFCYQLN